MSFVPCLWPICGPNLCHVYGRFVVPIETSMLSGESVSGMSLGRKNSM